tara:strand:- start:2671 stop:4014 length:1344 start_codon:yes stop_codon:yes gene_type:complete
MDIIIPIYNPSKQRQENLTFILNEMSQQKISNVFVCEQYHKDSIVHTLLKKYNSVNHKIYTIESEVFNKSKLINQSVNESTSDTIWLLDGDVYLNYNYVIKNIPDYTEFARPFEKIVLLNEQETSEIQKTNQIKLSDRSYDSYKGYGKYSMIFKRSLFDQLNGFDERYEGWGFQDLDFIKRIPNETKKGHTDNIGFHFYHEKQELSNYDDNKKIFGNIEERVKPKKSNSKLKEIDDKKEEDYYEKYTPTPKYIPKPTSTPPKKINKEKPKKIRFNPTWKRPTHIFLCKLYTGHTLSNLIKDWSNVILKDISQPTAITRTLSGLVRKKYTKKGSGFYFLKYLTEQYDTFDKNTVLVYMNESNKKQDTDYCFDLLKNINRRKFDKNLELGVAKFENKLGFIVTGELILLIKKYEYLKMLEDIRKLSKREQNECANNLPNFFLEYCVKKL